MSSYLFRLVQLLLLCLSIFSCSQTYKKPAESNRTITFLETTDVHGALFDINFIENTRTESSLAHVYSYVRSKRQEYGDDAVVLLDGGDNLQGQPVCNYYNYLESDKSTHAVLKAMRFMDYDAITVGNHDVEPGPLVYEPLKKYYKKAQIPWLAANIIDTRTGKAYFDEYVVLEKSGVRIAILGLCTPGIPEWLPKDVWPYMRFEGMVEAAKRVVTKLANKEDFDILVGLFHAGANYTYNNYLPTDEDNPNASLLVADEVFYQKDGERRGFDLIFVGHDHIAHAKKVQPAWSDSNDTVVLLGADDSCSAIAEAKAYFSLEKDEARLDSIEYSLYRINESKLALMHTIEEDHFTHSFSEQYEALEKIPQLQLEASDKFEQSFKDEKAATLRYVNEKIGVLQETITSRDAMFGDAAFNDLVHGLQLDIAEELYGTRPDFSFAAPLKRDTTIKAGPIYVRDLYKLYKYENSLYVLKLRGDEIIDYLEYSYENWINVMNTKDDHLINFAKSKAYKDVELKPEDVKTAYYNYDTIAGLCYEVDVRKLPGQKVTILGLDANLDGKVDEGEQSFDKSKVYTIVLNSYRGSGGGGHLTRGAGLTKKELQSRIIYKSAADMRHYFIEKIRSSKNQIRAQAIGHWKFIPEEWAASGIKRDYQILFPE